MVFENLQDKFLTPDVLSLAVAEFASGLQRASSDRRQDKDQFESRIKELEIELQNLVNAIAKGKSSTSVLLDSIHQRERELVRLKALLKKQQFAAPQISSNNLVDFARRRLVEICDLMKVDVTRAKVELGKHLSKITMKPDMENDMYELSGEWDLLGERAKTLLPEYIDCLGGR